MIRFLSDNFDIVSVYNPRWVECRWKNSYDHSKVITELPHLLHMFLFSRTINHMPLSLEEPAKIMPLRCFFFLLVFLTDHVCSLTGTSLESCSTYCCAVEKELLVEGDWKLLAPGKSTVRQSSGHLQNNPASERHTW